MAVHLEITWAPPAYNNMDIDRVEETQHGSSSTQATKRQTVLPVDDTHPFDLESYISNYPGLSFA